jgi:hypothetical protein
MDEAYSTHGIDKCTKNLLRKPGDHLENLGIRQKNTNKMYLKIECDDVQCIHLAQDRVQWHIVVNSVMKL